MNIPAKILSNILDNNAKDLISNVNVALLDKVQSRIEEMRKDAISKVYDEVDEAKIKGHDDVKHGHRLDDKNLANNKPPLDKITYGDVVRQRIHNAKKKAKEAGK